VDAAKVQAQVMLHMFKYNLSMWLNMIYYIKYHNIIMMFYYYTL